VQLGSFEIEGAALEVEGVDLRTAFRDFEPLQPDHLVADGRLPAGGWRIVGQLGPASGDPAQVAIAAPFPDEQGSWALVVFAHEPLGWRRVVSHPGPLYPTPGRAERRARLTLSWPHASLIFPSGSTPEIHVSLRNVSHQPVGGPDDKDYSDDDQHVLAFLLDRSGAPLPHATGINRGTPLSIPRLRPGEEADLPALLVTSIIETLPPGDYGVKAVLPTMELWSDVVQITLI